MHLYSLGCSHLYHLNLLDLITVCITGDMYSRLHDALSSVVFPSGTDCWDSCRTLHQNHGWLCPVRGLGAYILDHARRSERSFLCYDALNECCALSGQRLSNFVVDAVMRMSGLIVIRSLVV